MPESLHAVLITTDTNLLESGWKKAIAAIGKKVDFRETLSTVLQFLRDNSI
jgi:hypothetical protein